MASYRASTRRRGRVVKRIDSINVIPLIDVMLVMLAVVLTTASFIDYGRISVDVPRADVGAADDAGDGLRIEIDAGGGLLADGSAITLDALPGLLDEAAGREVVLAVDRGARFESFSGVVEVLQRHGQQRLSIVVENGGH